MDILYKTIILVGKFINISVVVVESINISKI